MLHLVTKNDNPKPLRPYCNKCGWRKGGPDSWDGVSCKCGDNEPPIKNVDSDGAFEAREAYLERLGADQ